MSTTEKHVTETPDLETILGIGVAPTKEKEYDTKAARLLAVNEQLKALKEEKQQLEDAIWTLTPDEPGEFIIEGEQYAFQVSRSELWKWDSNKLEALAASNPHVSAVVESKFSLPKKEYAPLLSMLPAPEIKRLEETLTRKPGKPRVKVSRKK